MIVGPWQDVYLRVHAACISRVRRILSDLGLLLESRVLGGKPTCSTSVSGSYHHLPNANVHMQSRLDPRKTFYGLLRPAITP